VIKPFFGRLEKLESAVTTEGSAKDFFSWKRPINPTAALRLIPCQPPTSQTPFIPVYPASVTKPFSLRNIADRSLISIDVRCFGAELLSRFRISFFHEHR
jgi:hypothetical protein